MSVRRERAEAGELLQNVRKNRKQNSELPFNASAQDDPDHRQIKTASFRRLFLFVMDEGENRLFVGSATYESHKNAVPVVFTLCHSAANTAGLFYFSLEIE